MPTKITTEDRREVSRGDRVFNYYGLEWGTIVCDPDASGWFEFRGESGRTTLLNGARISTYQPEWSK